MRNQLQVMIVVCQRLSQVPHNESAPICGAADVSGRRRRDKACGRSQSLGEMPAHADGTVLAAQIKEGT
jgi:hypothetical protein